MHVWDPGIFRKILCRFKKLFKEIKKWKKASRKK